MAGNCLFPKGSKSETKIQVVSAQLQNRQTVLHSLITRTGRGECIKENALQNPDLITNSSVFYAK
jgi:hypothetical protein